MKRQEGLEINHAILLSGFHKELGKVADKPILLSGLYEDLGRVGDQPCNIVIRVS